MGTAALCRDAAASAGRGEARTRVECCLHGVYEPPRVRGARARAGKVTVLARQFLRAASLVEDAGETVAGSGWRTAPVCLLAVVLVVLVLDRIEGGTDAAARGVFDCLLGPVAEVVLPQAATGTSHGG